MADRMIQAAKKRGRAYRCLHCPKLGRPDCIAERGRLESHVFKHHVQLDRVPFSCSQCMFHCINQEQYDRHLTNYAWHRQRGGESVRPLISPDPYVIDAKDVEQLSQEESLRYFLGRARTPASSPEAPREEVVPEVEKAPETELDILAEAAKEFVLDYTEEGTLSAEKVLVEVEVDSGETEVEEPLEEALDLRVVVQREPSDSNAGLEAPGKVVEVGSGEGVSFGVGSRKRQPSTSSVSSSSSSTSSSSSSESLRRSRDLMDTLATLVKQSADLINNSVDRVEGMVRDLADTLKGVAKKMEGLSSDSLGKCRCGEGAQGSGDGAGTGGARQVRENGDTRRSRSRSRSNSKVRDDRTGVRRSDDSRQKQSDGKSRSRSKSKVRDDRTGVRRSDDSRQKQSDRRDRSRSRGRSGRRLDNDKGHRVERISWRSRSRSVERGRRQRDGGDRQGELREGIKDRDSRKYRCNEGDREAGRDEERKRRERSRSGGKKCRSRERTGDVRQNEGRHGQERSRSDGGQRVGCRERTGCDRRDDERLGQERSKGNGGQRLESRDRDGGARKDDRRQRSERSSDSRDEGTEERWDRTRNERRN